MMTLPMRSVAAMVGLVIAALLCACGGGHFRTISPGETTSAPPYLEMRADAKAGTLHFPRGVYVLEAVDDNGFYYRAPQKIVQHSWSGGQPHDGGVFVAKRNHRKLRGYVIMPGGLTHVGNLSHTDHAFRYYTN
jgi:hypothetical protein